MTVQLWKKRNASRMTDTWQRNWKRLWSRGEGRGAVKNGQGRGSENNK